MEVVVTVNSKYDFSEVKKDISCEDAVSLSNHCLNCRNPMCKKGCPLEIDIPDFISAIKNEEYEIIVFAAIKNSFLVAPIR